MTRAYLSMGANIGDRLGNLQRGVQLLHAMPAITVTSVSQVYETQPVGGVVQDDFYNIAVRLETTLSAPELLASLHVIEQQLKRVREIHWGPRTIDLDILVFGDEVWSDDVLTIPHREMANRRFVLQPLLDVIAADRRHEIERLLASTTDTNWVRVVTGARVEYENI
ncbi:2-amino-4-hydroxy-6-hydroxymethyldihydropteridine diphosphokinase [Leuconostoc lactis]|uniref:2-amino-4-hydroxy-6-hydroxymethyldihydropteridine diphosphokinase n=1 Tax=Leuconostoc lactis TaxID=1246 RepID=A0AAP9EDL1_LEULA|nr:2-amino-4-hydroxy-6-hydroxymethyldihydropteridine diphosphokinase [Leuconostoc lactis]MCC2744280.1 2-amino-4-hydroxy-6-hydroxymethyldihydropteridine diphosphokinase [Leuconostoc lactis]MCC2754393.1 2-amino-4-hydroxy-6-hydroxymethyldihydropteridine diphosphokinase [Leuconostoc lactis]QEA44494.1 2-amino-4-hydroxy-6-hydroxymethyldihydropteridine diphosphokinase [Leuconostoc lactis]